MCSSDLNAFNRDPLFLDYVDFPGIVDVAEALHGNDCHIIGMTAWITGPGRPDQTLHADWLPVSLPADIMADQRRSEERRGGKECRSRVSPCH